MATHKLATPLRVGDLVNGINVEALDLVSISINFQPILDTPKDRPAHIKYWRDQVSVSCMLQHPASGWTHTVTLAEHTQKGKEAKAMWDKIKAAFPDFEKKILELLQEHLPEGTAK